MRAALKQDINYSVAEMVYGEALRLPGEFSVSVDGDWATYRAFVVYLRQKVRQMRLVPLAWHGGEAWNYVPR